MMLQIAAALEVSLGQVISKERRQLKERFAPAEAGANSFGFDFTDSGRSRAAWVPGG